MTDDLLVRVYDVLCDIARSRVGHCGTSGRIYCPHVSCDALDEILAELRKELDSLTTSPPRKEEP